LIMAVQAPGVGGGTWAWGNRFLWGYEPERDDPVIAATVAAAVAAGVRFFDSADSYGTGAYAGRSERLLGQAVAALPADQRQGLIVATKLAPFPWRWGRRGFDRGFAASRARLGGRLDRVQLHWSTARYAPWQEGALLQGLGDLVEAGVVRELGISNMGPRRLRRWHALLQQRGLRISSLQVQFSLLASEPLAPGGVAEVCRELGIELIAYSPLALGLLGGRWSLEGPLPSGPRGVLFRRLLPALQPLLALMQEMAGCHQISLTALALNWCRSHGAMPIPGLRRVEHVEAVREALACSLSEDDRRRLDEAVAMLQVSMPANPFSSS
jgi:pyridoxine 4-dehydrogenase